MALSEKKAITDKRHHEKLDRLVIQPYKEHGAAIRAAAAVSGESLQGYILKAIDDRIERDAAKAERQAAERAAVERVNTTPTPRPAPAISEDAADAIRAIDDLDQRKNAMIAALRGEVQPEQLEHAAAAAGQSVDEWVADAIRDKL